MQTINNQSNKQTKSALTNILHYGSPIEIYVEWNNWGLDSLQTGDRRTNARCGLFL